MVELGKQVIDLVKDKQQPESERKQAFARLVNQNFDVKDITRFSLGPYWRDAPVAERKQFARVVNAYLIDVMWSRFGNYSGQHFAVTKTVPLSDGLTLVKSEIVSPNGANRSLWAGKCCIITAGTKLLM